MSAENLSNVAQRDRLVVLDEVLALVRGDERWSSIDTLEFAEWVQSGKIPQFSPTTGTRLT